MTEQKNNNVKLKVFLWIMGIMVFLFAGIYGFASANSNRIYELDKEITVEMNVMKEEIVEKINDVELNIVKELVPIKTKLNIDVK